MSFAGKVKEELREQTGKAKHCQLAELAALFACCGQVVMGEDGSDIILFTTENLTVAKKCYILIKKAFHIVPDLSIRGHHQYLLYLLEDHDVLAFMEALRVFDGAYFVSEALIQRSCCLRAFLRGLFLAIGSVTNPNSGYHLELAAGSHDRAVQIQEMMGVFELEAKITERKKNCIVYMKEGASIVDFLNVIGAHVALMEFENVRILKEMRNSINRQVNCETANIKKTVSAASRQTSDIQYIHDTIGFGTLSENLAQIARLRLANPEVSLKELGEMLNPPIGKSGVNHRLRKLSEIAEGLRRQRSTEI
ncbi:MAG: DNA-binding protein WhiA [Lachnospiraceae bacterium]|nr:DNA-binding protein WhiA [Lachnospiraceae bacterium]